MEFSHRTFPHWAFPHHRAVYQLVLGKNWICKNDMRGGGGVVDYRVDASPYIRTCIFPTGSVVCASASLPLLRDRNSRLLFIVFTLCRGCTFSTARKRTVRKRPMLKRPVRKQPVRKRSVRKRGVIELAVHAIQHESEHTLAN